jgi:hypothetical protein
MNYGELKQAIQDYLEVHEAPFTDHLDEFIEAAEQRIYNEVNLPATRKTVAGTLTIGDGAIDLTALPDTFLAPISLKITVAGLPTFLLNKELDYLAEMYPSATPALPTLYAQVDNESLVVRPIPDLGYAYSLQYYAKTDSIVAPGDDAHTSWLGDNFDGVLLFAALVEGAVFNKQDPAVYETGFLTKMELLKVLIDGKNQQDQYRQGSPRKEVPKEK